MIGVVDDQRFYNRALSSNEVWELAYNTVTPTILKAGEKTNVLDRVKGFNVGLDFLKSAIFLRRGLRPRQDQLLKLMKYEQFLQMKHEMQKEIGIYYTEIFKGIVKIKGALPLGEKYFLDYLAGFFEPTYDQAVEFRLENTKNVALVMRQRHAADMLRVKPKANHSAAAAGCGCGAGAAACDCAEDVVNKRSRL